MLSITPFIVTIILVNFSSCLYSVLGADNTGLATWYGTETGSGKGNEPKIHVTRMIIR